MNLPAGDINDQGQNFVVRTAHELGSLAEVQNVVVGFERTLLTSLINLDVLGQPIPLLDPPELPRGEERLFLLKDVANVRLGTANASSISRTNGRPSLAITVTKEEDAITIGAGPAQCSWSGASPVG